MTETRPRLTIGADHAGFALKEALKAALVAQGYDVVDAGTSNAEPADYPDFATLVARAISRGTGERGILICGSGIGMSITANRFPGVRAALCLDAEAARLSRLHNDANILVLAARRTGTEAALEITFVWLATPFEGGRHQRRLEKLRAIEREICSTSSTDLEEE
ncbi:MAG: ribose 5-phosphate isomerase B [Syntrophales bacterium]|jgi:ribose 5-phosphate isomerase B|nr:ribose 5-phosphate isomerase B [Syntrophales bacterium]HOG07666.1 ribose 5-phosphate isomerase B [Syntrophales bacterium]HOS77376.1 ribose 5-phosphate isomerase B [Syntrophales bacterium]HPB71307.1 ribose 5-phosphate isomerase B [Syntrophales bacterium]HQP29588.1 ribose 5-phosphate isomerase B [Syntrophales bacterium]